MWKRRMETRRKNSECFLSLLLWRWFIFPWDSSLLCLSSLLFTLIWCLIVSKVLLHESAIYFQIWEYWVINCFNFPEIKLFLEANSFIELVNLYFRCNLSPIMHNQFFFPLFLFFYVHLKSIRVTWPSITSLDLTLLLSHSIKLPWTLEMARKWRAQLSHVQSHLVILIITVFCLRSQQACYTDPQALTHTKTHTHTTHSQPYSDSHGQGHRASIVFVLQSEASDLHVCNGTRKQYLCVWSY